MNRLAFLSPLPTPSHLSRAPCLSSLHSALFAAPCALPRRRAYLSTTVPKSTATSTSASGGTTMSAAGRDLKSVVIAGGTGFVGRRLAERLLREGTSVTILTRNAGSASVPAGAAAVTWDPTSSAASPAWHAAVRGADGVVNLCGEPIVTRWSESAKQTLRSSRLGPTSALSAAVAAAAAEGEPVSTIVTASAVGFYGTSMPYDTVVNEDSPAGSGYAADLCAHWEKLAMSDIDGTTQPRKVSVRIGLVLGAGGGALAKMIPAYQLFVGGPLGSGRQWVSWVHVDDVVGIICESLRNEAMSGAVNATAPNAVTMGEMCAALAKALRRPNLFAVPEFALQTLFGEASMILLEGQRVEPAKMVAAGYQFQYSDINDAMRAISKEL